MVIHGRIGERLRCGLYLLPSLPLVSGVLESDRGTDSEMKREKERTSPLPPKLWGTMPGRTRLRFESG